MSHAALVLTATIFLMSFLIGGNSIAGVAGEQVCDVGADHSLGVEVYSETIRRHVEVLNQHPQPECGTGGSRADKKSRMESRQAYYTLV